MRRPGTPHRLGGSWVQGCVGSRTETHVACWLCEGPAQATPSVAGRTRLLSGGPWCLREAGGGLRAWVPGCDF